MKIDDEWIPARTSTGEIAEFQDQVVGMDYMYHRYPLIMAAQEGGMPPAVRLSAVVPV